MDESNGHIAFARTEKAKALVRTIYNDLRVVTPLQAVTATKNLEQHRLWWVAVAEGAGVNCPSQQTVDVVLELIEFVEEIKEIENRVDGSTGG